MTLLFASLRKLLLVSGLIFTGMAVSGCDPFGGDSDDPAPALTANSDTSSDDDGTDEGDDTVAVAGKDVTGVWLFKHEIMRLTQSGASIQGTTEVIGFKNDPADPVEAPVPTVGSMSSDGTVKVSELINYLKNPSKNYQVVKVGGLKDANTLVLNVVKGQKPHTQVWTRK